MVSDSYVRFINKIKSNSETEIINVLTPESFEEELTKTIKDIFDESKEKNQHLAKTKYGWSQKLQNKINQLSNNQKSLYVLCKKAYDEERKINSIERWQRIESTLFRCLNIIAVGVTTFFLIIILQKFGWQELPSISLSIGGDSVSKQGR